MSLKKIAEMTGVSVSTVSRVLNNKGYNCASEEVKQRIRAAAMEIHYVPNEAARLLQCCNDKDAATPAKKIAVILGRRQTLDEDPFFAELYVSIEQAAFAQGCVISELISAEKLLSPVRSAASLGRADYETTHQTARDTACQTASDAAHNVVAESSLPPADGYLVLGRCAPELLKRLRAQTRNIVAVGRNPTEFEIDEVVCDGKKAAEDVMRCLIEKGDRRIAYIGDCTYETRYVGYCESLIRNGIPMDYSLICQTDQTESAGYDAMRHLLPAAPDAIFCANDATALGVLRAYNEVIPPTHIDIISIDNIRQAEETSPLLTTMNVPSEDMGRMAVKILLDRIAHGHAENMRIEFPSRIVRRESC